MAVTDKGASVVAKLKNEARQTGVGFYMTNEEKLKENLVSIASEFFRFEKVFKKAIGKLEVDDQNKYSSQFAWFAKKVTKALEDSELHLVNIEGQIYDPGMAVTPLNIDDFDSDDKLFVEQIIEPIIMSNSTVYKTGTVILGRAKQ